MARSEGGMIFVQGDLDLYAETDIHINDDVTLQNSGAVSVYTDSDQNNVGSFNLAASKTINIGNSTLILSIAQIDLQGSISGTAGNIILESSINSNIDLGTDLGNLFLSDAVLAKIDTSGTLTFRGDNTTVFINGWAAGSNLSGTVVIDAFNVTVWGAGLSTSSADLVINAADGFSLSSAINVNGVVTINADSNNTGTGTFNASGGSVNTNGNSLTVIAKDFNLTINMNLGTETLYLSATQNGSIGIGDVTGQDFVISGSELQRITAGQLIIGGVTTGNIIVEGLTDAMLTAITADITLSALADNASVTLTDTSATFDSLTIEADNGISLNTGLFVSNGDLILNADYDGVVDGTDELNFSVSSTLTASQDILLSAKNGGVVADNELTLSAGRHITLQNNSTLTSTGDLTITAATTTTGTVTIASGVDTSNSGDLVITADNMVINGTVNVGAHDISILPASSGTSIGLGDSAIGDVVFSDSQLDDFIVGGLLTFGNSKTNAIDIDLWSVGVNITGALNLTAKDTLGIITLDGQSLLVNSALTLMATSDVTLNQAVVANGVVTIDTTGTLVSNGISSNNQSIIITTNGITLNDALNSGTAPLVINFLDTSVVTIATGGADTLSSSELSQITSTGLTINALNTIGIDIGSVDLSGYGSVLIAATANNANVDLFGTILAHTLEIRTDNGMTIAGDVITSGGALILNADFDNASDGNDSLVLVDPTPILSAATTLTVNANNGGVVSSNALVFSATSGITVTGDITVTGNSDLTFNAGSGLVTLYGVDTSAGSGNQVSITAADVSLLGVFNVGDDDLSFLPYSGTNISLGDTVASFRLSDSELDLITVSGTLTFGNNDTNMISVDNWSVAGGISGDIVLTAMGTPGTIQFVESSSDIPNNITVNANQGLTVSQPIVGGGNFTITASDFDLTSDLNIGAGNLTITPNTAVTVSLGEAATGFVIDNAELARISLSGILTIGGDLVSAMIVDGLVIDTNKISGSIVLKATASDASITLTDTASSMLTDVTLLADGNIAIDASLTTNGQTTLVADYDNSGQGLLSIGAGAVLSTSNNSLSITADDMVVTGSINASDIVLIAATATGISLGNNNQDFDLSVSELGRINVADFTIGRSDSSNNISSIEIDGKRVALLRMRFGRRDPSAPFALARRLYHAAAVRVTGATCTSHTAHRLSHDSTPA